MRIGTADTGSRSADVFLPGRSRMNRSATGRFIARYGADLIVLAIVAAALAARRWNPSLPWFLPAAFIIAYLLDRLCALSRAERRWVLLWCAVALVIATSANLLVGFHDPVPPTQLDDHRYYANSKAIAEVWHTGFFPDLAAKGSSEYYLGTLHTGYERVLATMFYLCGARAWLAIALNVGCLAVMPLLLYLLGLQLFSNLTEPRAADKAARNAAVLGALYPGPVYWSGWVVRDLLIAACFLASLVLVLDFLRFRRLSMLAGFLLAAWFLWSLRAYAALSIFAGLFLYFLAVVPPRIAIWGMVYAAIGVFAVTCTETGERHMAQLTFSLGEFLPDQTRTIPGTVVYLAAGLRKLLLAPYAWVPKAFGELPAYGLYPGMWFLYLIVYPLALAGGWLAVRRNHLLTCIPVACLLSGAGVFLLSYGGDAPRQRVYLEMLLISYAGLGTTAPRRRVFFIACYAVLFVFAVVQFISLYRRFGAYWWE